MYALALQAVDNGLTLKDIVLDIPHDMAALVVYAMVGIFVFFIWFASKPSVVARHSAKYDAVEPQSDAYPHPETVTGEANTEGSGASAYPHVRPAARKPVARRKTDAARIVWIG